MADDITSIGFTSYRQDEDGNLYVPLKEVLAHLKASHAGRGTGEWIGSYTGYECSVCGFWIDDEVFCYLTKPIIDDGFNFCPNCGTDMRGNNDD